MNRYIPMICAAALAIGLSACATPISKNPVNDVVSALPGGANGGAAVLTKDLASADWNLHQAIGVGALDASDPAPKCLDEAMSQMGLNPDGTTVGGTSTSFVPKNDGLISAGAVLYIRFQQAKKIQAGGITVPVDCKAVVGQLVLDSMAFSGKVGLGAITGGLAGTVVPLPPLQ